jgi:hypothetical protein
MEAVDGIARGLTREAQVEAAVKVGSKHDGEHKQEPVTAVSALPNAESQGGPTIAG